MNFNSWIFKFWPLSRYEAITLPWAVYFKSSIQDTDLEIINHERIHIEQRKKIGVFNFYFSYLCEYFRNLWKYKNHDLAYRNISFEIEAYARQGEKINE